MRLGDDCGRQATGATDGRALTLRLRRSLDVNMGMGVFCRLDIKLQLRKWSLPLNRRRYSRSNFLAIMPLLDRLRHEPIGILKIYAP